MIKYKDHTVKEYLDELSKRAPVPGGGSAAALTAATGAALISMVARYSLNKGKPKSVEKKIRDILKKSEAIRRRLIVLIDLDANAYLGVVKVRKASAKVKQKALKRASAVPAEVAKLCYQAVKLTPYLIKNGNPFLLSDIVVSAELLMSAFNGARTNAEVNL